MSTKMALLTQFLQTDLSECRHKLFGHSEEMLCVSLPMIDFVMKGRLSNIVPNPACPTGGFSGWTSLQELASDRGVVMAATEADVVVRDSRLATADQIARSSKVVLDVVIDGRRAWLETGTVASFLLPMSSLWRPMSLRGGAGGSTHLVRDKPGDVRRASQKLAQCNSVCGGRLLGPGALSELQCGGVNDSQNFCPRLPYPGVPGPALPGTFLGELPRSRPPSTGVEYSLAPTGRAPRRFWHGHARQP